MLVDKLGSSEGDYEESLQAASVLADVISQSPDNHNLEVIAQQVDKLCDLGFQGQNSSEVRMAAKSVLEKLLTKINEKKAKVSKQQSW